MSDAKITVILDGPLKAEGVAALVDHEDQKLPTTEGSPIFLCRCGASEKKPFCDGTHKRIAFKGS